MKCVCRGLWAPSTEHERDINHTSFLIICLFWSFQLHLKITGWRPQWDEKSLLRNLHYNWSIQWCWKKKKIHTFKRHLPMKTMRLSWKPWKMVVNIYNLSQDYFVLLLFARITINCHTKCQVQQGQNALIQIIKCLITIESMNRQSSHETKAALYSIFLVLNEPDLTTFFFQRESTQWHRCTNNTY